jgi:hypothetical protein
MCMLKLAKDSGPKLKKKTIVMMGENRRQFSPKNGYPSKGLSTVMLTNGAAATLITGRNEEDAAPVRRYQIAGDSPWRAAP